MSSKIPGINKWKPVSQDGFDCSDIPGKKTIYFSNTTTPTRDDIVKVTIPERPKITKFSYNTVADKWTIKANADLTGRCILNGTLYGSTEKEEVECLKAYMDEIKLTGGYEYVYLNALDGRGNMVTMGSDDALTLDQAYLYNNFVFGPNASRRSVIKRIKISRKSNGPAVTIDYNNHYIKVPSNVEAVYTSDLGQIADYEKGDKPDEAKLGSSTVYFYNDESAIYNFRTKETSKNIESLDTIVQLVRHNHSQTVTR